MTGQELDREAAIDLLLGMAARLKRGEPIKVAGCVLARLALEMMGRKPH